MAPQLIGMSWSESQAVMRALDLLDRAVPEEYDHFYREIDSVGVAPGACGLNAIACTAGNFGRHVNLEYPPDTMDIIELAVTLSHEARHHDTDDHGWHRVIDHTCVNCADPVERAYDAIYVRDEQVRSALRRYCRLETMRMQPHSHRARPLRRGDGAGVVLALTAVGAVLTGWALASRR